MARWIVTGVAGFIGFHTAHALRERGVDVVGIDNVNDYYDQLLKRERLGLSEVLVNVQPTRAKCWAVRRRIAVALNEFADRIAVLVLLVTRAFSD